MFDNFRFTFVADLEKKPLTQIPSIHFKQIQYVNQLDRILVLHSSALFNTSLDSSVASRVDPDLDIFFHQTPCQSENFNEQGTS